VKLFTRKTLVFLLVIGIGTFILGLLLTAHTGSLFDQTTPGSSSFSRSLVGHHALAEFLRQSGVIVLVARNPALLNESRSFPLLLLEPLPPEADLQLEDVSHQASVRRLLRNANRSSAPVLVALPKWRVEPAQMIPGWIRSQHLLPRRGVKNLLWTILTAEDEDASGPPGEDLILRSASIHNPRADLLGIPDPGLHLPDPVQLLSPREGLKPLLWCDEGVLIGMLESGDILISDPDLFNNRGLGRGDHAVILLSLFVDLISANGVVMDESLHGFSSQSSLLQRALSFPLVLVCLHVLLLLLLLAWSLSVRFGAPRQPPPELPPGKELLIDNTSRLLQWAGDHANAYRRYLQINLADVARRYILVDRGWFDEKQLLPNLQQVTDARGLAVDLTKLETATRSDNLSPIEAVRLARRIHAWRRALLGVSAKEDS
jgi:hypothetical protein